MATPNTLLNSSTTKYRGGMLAPQQLALPLLHKKESSGTFRYAEMAAPHRGQWLGGLTTDISRGQR